MTPVKSKGKKNKETRGKTRQETFSCLAYPRKERIIVMTAHCKERKKREIEREKRERDFALHVLTVNLKFDRPLLITMEKEKGGNKILFRRI